MPVTTRYAPSGNGDKGAQEDLLALLWQIRAAQPWVYASLQREFVFDEVGGRKWRFDMAWPHLRLALEVDGGSWAGGRHTSGAGFEEDCVKLSTAAAQGWRVLRFTPHMIEDGRAIGLVIDALNWGM